MFDNFAGVLLGTPVLCPQKISFCLDKPGNRFFGGGGNAFCFASVFSPFVSDGRTGGPRG